MNRLEFAAHLAVCAGMGSTFSGLSLTNKDISAINTVVAKAAKPEGFIHNPYRADLLNRTAGRMLKGGSLAIKDRISATTLRLVLPIQKEN